MFREIGTNMDNKIQDIKEWGYKSKVYGLYSRLRIPAYVRKIERIDALNRFLSYCLTRNWITEKTADRYREDWFSMQKKKEGVKE